MKTTATRELEWQITWNSGGHYNAKTFTDIDEVKAFRTVLVAMRSVGLASDLSTQERLAAIPAGQWQRPAWVERIGTGAP